MSTPTVASNLERVRERIARAADRAGRKPGEVLLIGVSKTVDVDRIREAIVAGVPALGENRVQEAKAKVTVLGRDVPWHLIGHLQTNKVKDALDTFDVIHSLDRLALAEELERRAARLGRHVEVFVEVNLAAEPAKSGVAPDALPAMLEQVAQMSHVRVRGLMAIPPVGAPDDTRQWFRAVRKLAEAHTLAELSMGMSADYEVAIEEGATAVRVGTAIFGARAPRA
jgi:hypothetical protein